jgi:hypothetical protein
LPLRDFNKLNKIKAERVLIYLSALVAIGYFLGAAGVDPDIWGHLKFGEEIIVSSEVPRSDLYSFTAYHNPWVDHEWLAEVIMAGVFRWAGSAGLILFRLLSGIFLVCLLAAMVFRESGEPGSSRPGLPPEFYYIWVVIF